MKRLSEEQIEAVARRARALGDPTRVRILDVLGRAEHSVGEIAKALGSEPSNISKHLQVLHEAGLVARRRAASTVIYSMGDPELSDWCRYLATLRPALHVYRRTVTRMERVRTARGAAAAQESGATTLLLIRHAHTDALGHRLVGRGPCTGLSGLGQTQADSLGQALATVQLAAVYTSPRMRAVHTACGIARYQVVKLTRCDGLDEVDFGEWTGKTFSELDTLSGWRRFNEARATAEVPDGETAVAVQRRIVSTLAAIAARHPAHTIAIVSHADVLRAAILHYTSTPLDRVHAIGIDPASVTTVRSTPQGMRVCGVNDCVWGGPE